MSYLVPLIALFVIAGVAFLIVRVGAIALMMTGLPRETANFQAISAFFGVGFTTEEAELVVTHSVRRKITQHLIVAGNLGITSALATFVATMITGEMGRGGGGSRLDAIWPLLYAVGGIVLLFGVMGLPPVRGATEWVIRKSLKRAGVIRPMDYDLLLRVVHGYVLSELTVSPESPLAGRTLTESGLGQLGVLVLGISRADGSYIGAPAGRDVIEPGDQLIVYGREEDLQGLGLVRRRGRAAAGEPGA